MTRHVIHIVCILIAIASTSLLAAAPPLELFVTDWDGSGDTGVVYGSARDGSGLRAVETNLARPRPIDADGARVYFSFLTGIVSMRLDGSGRTSLAPYDARALDLDRASGGVYLTTGVGVWRLADDGSLDQVILDTTGDLDGLEIHDGWAYWTNALEDYVARSPLSTDDFQLLPIEIVEPGGIEIVRDRLYVCERGRSRILRTRVDGTEAEVLIEGEPVHDLAVDPAGGWIYWTAGPGGSTVKRARLVDGSGVETVIDGLVGPRGIALAPRPVESVSDERDLGGI